MRTCEAMEEDWRVLVSFLPGDWKELATATHAIKGLRQDKSEENLLRTLLIHVGCGYSLRETVVRARESGLADLSDVALLKRLRKCQEWLYELCRGLFQERGLHPPEPAPKRLRLIDATLVKEPGKTGSLWRIHYSVLVPSLRCDHFKLTATEGEGTGESFWQFPVQPGDYLIADRGYSSMDGIAGTCEQGAYVLVRLNHWIVRLERIAGKSFDLLRNLETLRRAAQIGSWKVALAAARGRVRGRICAVRKSEAAIARAHRQLRRKASKNGSQLQPETLEYAKYVVVFTTFPTREYSPASVLEWYRLRWQVELVFKRFKQIADLGHLPKYDEGSSKAWLYGKLVVALLTEKLVEHASAFSPWGYELEEATPLESVA